MKYEEFSEDIKPKFNIWRETFGFVDKRLF